MTETEIPTISPSEKTEQARIARMGAEDERAREDLHDRVKRDFSYHPPRDNDEAQMRCYGHIRSTAQGLAIKMVDFCPPGRELDTALVTLETAVFHANAAIARHG